MCDLAGPIVMDLTGFTEQGFKRKLAVQTLFGKIMYLSEVSCWRLLYQLKIAFGNFLDFQNGVKNVLDVRTLCYNIVRSLLSPDITEYL